MIEKEHVAEHFPVEFCRAKSTDMIKRKKDINYAYLNAFINFHIISIDSQIFTMNKRIKLPAAKSSSQCTA